MRENSASAAGVCDSIIELNVVSALVLEIEIVGRARRAPGSLRCKIHNDSAAALRRVQLRQRLSRLKINRGAAAQETKGSVVVVERILLLVDPAVFPLDASSTVARNTSSPRGKEIHLGLRPHDVWLGCEFFHIILVHGGPRARLRPGGGSSAK